MITAPTQLDLTGGESVYCINTFQVTKAVELFEGAGESSQRVREAIETLEESLSRNERAAVAMLLLRRLKARPE